MNGCMKTLVTTVGMLFLLGGAVLASGEAEAEEFPSREIQVIATFGAGGGVDTFTRALTASASEHLGQEMVVRNVTGAGGATGAIEVYNSRPDGYTLMSIDSSLTTLEVFRGDDLPFKTSEFEPLGIVMYSPTWIISNTAQTYPTFDDFLSAAEANPGEVSIGTAGPSGSQFLMAQVLEAQLNIDLNIVPFDGGGTLMSKLAGDQVDAGSIHTPVGIDFIEAGEIKVLALGGPRDAVAVDVEDVPTFGDLGIPQEFMVYRALFAPPGTPQEIIDVLAEAVRKMAQDEQFQEFGASWGVMPTYLDPEASRELMERDLEMFKEVYRRFVE